MQSPVVALVWECWRLSRRWYLWVLLAAIAFNLGLVNLSPRLPTGGQPIPPEVIRELMARVAFMLNFILAMMTTLLAITVGGKAGFPLSFEYRLPIRTSALVAIPMAYLATICASLYVVPLLLSRLLYDLPFPLLPGAAVLATVVVSLLTCGWATTTTTIRNSATLAVILGGIQLFAWLDPVTFRTVSPQPLSSIMVLEAGEYAVLSTLCVLLFGLALVSIQQQRSGEAPTAALVGILLPKQRSTATSNRAELTSALLDWAADRFTLPCPVGAPWRAELWLELKRHAFPVMLLSAVVALCVPLLFALGFNPAAIGVGALDYAFPLAIFFTGIGTAIFNRRLRTSGYLSAFEGTRGMGTTSLAVIQVLCTTGSTFAGIVLVCVSVALASLLLDEPGALARHLDAAVAGFAERGPLLLLSDLVLLLMTYASTVALFACVQVVSVVSGRWFFYGVVVVAFYGILFTFLMLNGDASLQAIQNHMWGFAGFVLALTPLALARTLSRGMLSLPAVLAALLCWGVFLACGLYSLASRGIVLPNQAPELQALNGALLLLPLTLFLLLIWGYDRLRHR